MVENYTYYICGITDKFKSARIVINLKQNYMNNLKKKMVIKFANNK